MAKSSIQYVSVEADVLTSAVGEVVSRAWDQSKILQSAGRAAFEAIAETSRTQPAEELAECATWLRGVATHALAVVAELHYLAGRLQGLAEGRGVVEAASSAE